MSATNSAGPLQRARPRRVANDGWPSTRYPIAIVTSLVLGLGLPAWIAYCEGGLNKSDVVARILERETAYKKRADKTQDALEAAKKNPSKTIPQCFGCLRASNPVRDAERKHNEALAKWVDWVNVAALAKADAVPQGETRGPAIMITPFFPGEATLAWPFAFMALLALCFTYPYPRRQDRRFFVWCSLGLGAFMVGANAVRQYPTTYADGRRLFGFASFDLGPWSCGYQLFMFALDAMLIAWVWTCAREEGRERHEVELHEMPVQVALCPARAQLLSDGFVRWQRRTFLLVCAFVPGAFVYWRIVSKFGDTRYLIAAGCYHIQYVLTWYFVSLPLFEQWHRWHEWRARAVAQLGREAALSKVEAQSAEFVLQALKELQITPRHAAVQAVVVTVASLLAPFFHALFL
jgi:hypothetical protein